MSNTAILTNAELADVIVSINKANGWDVTTPVCWENHRKIKSKITLIHTEVAEAAESARHDDKENFARELADIEVRILDTVGGLGLVELMGTARPHVEYELDYVADGWDDKEAVLATLEEIHYLICFSGTAALDGDKEGFCDGMASALTATRLAAKAYGIDLAACVHVVLEKNRQQGFRHGGKTI